MMRNVLIVSPRFPPTSAADLHRVRQSLPHFADFGWRATVLAVKPQFVESCQDPLLAQALDPDVRIERVRAVSATLTRTIGVGDLALRSFPFLYRAGARLLQRGEFDLVYFSTTAFTAMALGRMWKERFGVPFVLDLQDPWLSDYYDDKPASATPAKYRFAHALHSTLEPWTMKAVDGLVSVSAGYLVTMRRRYPWLRTKPQVVLPFGASTADFDVVRKNPQPNPFFTKKPGQLNGVYVGRGGRDMEVALRIIFDAFARGRHSRPELFGQVRLNFVGTDYATADRARLTVAPLARELGVSDFVREWPGRIPYFQALQLLEDADFVIVPGSDDPDYTASKIYPYILARKPLLAVFHTHSTVCKVLDETRAGTVIRFDTTGCPSHLVSSFLREWCSVLSRLPFEPVVNWTAFQPYLATETTRQQCALFDDVLARQASSDGATVPRLRSRLDRQMCQ